MKIHHICLLPGDGIGPEVTKAAQDVLAAAGAPIEWVHCDAGAEYCEKTGELLPQATLDAIEKHKIAFKGPLTTPIGKGFRSVNVSLRKIFKLYASVRPVRNLDGIKTRFENVDLVVMRENTEGLYAGLEHQITEGVTESIKICTREASERIARYAFEYAKEKGRKKVTAFHKANIMKLTDGLFIQCAQEVSQDYPEIEYNELIIDNACMQMVKDPTQFDVLLMENLYGDVVSDLCSGLVGGLGVVPGANIGQEYAIFESVHGSAPDIAGLGVANPLACIMSSVMMLRHLGEDACADRIRDAYNKVLASSDPSVKTKDIGGTGNTQSFVKALKDQL